MRRALLLFAIVLGLAAIAASLAPPTPDVGTTPDGGMLPPDPTPPSPAPAPADGDAAEVRFVSGARDPERQVIGVGERAVVTVAVDTPGQVSIDGLGLLQPAEPGTPARFDILPRRAGTYDVLFRPVTGDPQRVGVIAVEAA